MSLFPSEEKSQLQDGESLASTSARAHDTEDDDVSQPSSVRTPEARKVLELWTELGQIPTVSYTEAEQEPSVGITTASVNRAKGETLSAAPREERHGKAYRVRSVDEACQLLTKEISHAALDMCGLFMGCAGMKRVAAALKDNKMVTAINLSCNRVEADGAQSLAKALIVNDTLSSLDLRGNNIRCAGATHIAKALQSNTSLTAINLSANGIGRLGAADLAEAFEVNCTLCSVGLYGNGFGDSAVKVLTEAVQFSSSITHFDIRGLNVQFTHIEKQMLLDLATAMEKKKKHMVLTVARTESGHVVCTTLGGGEVAVQKPTDSLSMLAEAAASEAGLPPESLRFVRADGICIHDARGQRSLEELLACNEGDLGPIPITPPEV